MEMALIALEDELFQKKYTMLYQNFIGGNLKKAFKIK